MSRSPVEGYDHNKELRIILLGKTGVGKSAVGNTILGRKEFKSCLSPSSVTTDTVKKWTVEDNKLVAVVDTPGLFDTEIPNEKIQNEITKCIQFSCPGPHAFLVVMQLCRFTDEEQRSVEALQEIFGEEASKFMVILFTRGDDLEGQSIHDFVDNAHPTLKEVIEKCGNRYHVFNNREMSNRDQVKELLDIIDHMMALNGGSFYTQEMFEEAEAKIRQKMAEIRRKENFNKTKNYWQEKDNEEKRYREMAEKSDLKCGFEERLKHKVSNAYNIAINRLFSKKGAPSRLCR